MGQVRKTDLADDLAVRIVQDAYINAPDVCDENTGVNHCLNILSSVYLHLESSGNEPCYSSVEEFLASQGEVS